MAKKTVTSRVGSFRGKNRADADKRKRGANYGYLSVPNGISVFTVEADEKYTFDFLPYLVKDKNHPNKDSKNEIAVPGSYWYKRPFEIHKNIGPKNEAVVCPRSFGKPCPICDYRDELLAQAIVAHTAKRRSTAVYKRTVEKEFHEFSDEWVQYNKTLESMGVSKRAAAKVLGEAYDRGDARIHMGMRYIKKLS